MLFHTCLITCDYPTYPAFPYRTRTWSIDLVDAPTYNGAPRFAACHDDRIVEGKEIVIDARDKQTAARVLNLIVESAGLLQSDLALVDDSLERLFSAAEVSDLRERTDFEERPFWHTSSFPLACLVAQRCSFRKERAYALAKWKLSAELVSFAIVDLDPHYSPTLVRSQFPEDHVRFALAIIAAYSVIEELRLEVRASQKNPSTINGQWNPKVRSDLEQRLRSAGINVDQKFLWSVRGPRTALEASQPAQIYRNAIPSPWSRWSVRDLEVDLVDAIAHASWLRSRVSSHRLSPEWAGLLSPYDVANCQHLGRRLLLERIGLLHYLRPRRTNAAKQE